VFQVACQNGLRRLVKLLLKHGADVNAQNQAGNTALHFAHLYGFGDALGTLLVQEGADRAILNAKNESAVQAGKPAAAVLPAIQRSAAPDRAPTTVPAEEIEEAVVALYETEDFASDEAYDAATGCYGSEDWCPAASAEGAQEDSAAWGPAADTVRVATQWRPPPPSATQPAASSVVVRKSTVKRPPPTTPHPSAASLLPTPTPAGVAGAVATPKADPFSRAAVKAEALPPPTRGPVSPSEPAVSLMEAMVSNDLAAMGKALHAASDRDVASALLNASARGNSKAAAILLAKAPEESIVQGSMIAARAGHGGVLALLLSACPDPKALNSALVQAAARGHAQIVSGLAERHRTQLAAEPLKRALLSAANKNFPDAVLALIAATEYDDKRFALVSACTNGHKEGQRFFFR